MTGEEASRQILDALARAWLLGHNTGLLTQAERDLLMVVEMRLRLRLGRGGGAAGIWTLRRAAARIEAETAETAEEATP